MGRYAGQRRQTSCVSRWIKFAFVGVFLSVFFQGALCEVEPTESQCRPYIEKALKEQHQEIDEKNIEEELDKTLINEQQESPPTDKLTDSTEGLITKEDEGNDNDEDIAEDKGEGEEEDDDEQENEDAIAEEAEDNTNEEDDWKIEDQNVDGEGEENVESEESIGRDGLEVESFGNEDKQESDVKEDDEDTTEDQKIEEDDSEVRRNAYDKDEYEEKIRTEAAPSDEDDDDDDKDSNLENPIDIEVQEIEIDEDDDENDKEDTDDDEEKGVQDNEDKKSVEKEDDKEEDEDQADDDENNIKEKRREEADKNYDENETLEEQNEQKEETNEEDDEVDNKELVPEKEQDDEVDDKELVPEKEQDDEVDDKELIPEKEQDDEKEVQAEEKEKDAYEEESNDKKDDDDVEIEKKIEKKEAKRIKPEGAAKTEAEEDIDREAPEEEELINEMFIPENLRPRDHIDKILKLEDSGLETILEKTIDTTLKALKGLYDNAIKPLEMLYKYRDLSNRHFGDPEIFSKPLILFMGPWSGGKSSTINYLLDNEFSRTSLRTGAEPSPAYFNILMHGEEEEILDGTQLAADWTFSGLQKFGQSLLDRLKGIKLPNKLLEKVNIVEIPGILEIRKQVQRLFPFNDACQWFIDRADIIFLVYDPSKLDVGPETEAILDQLKGREYQTRIILNKADQVKPEELMRVQGTLIWNISPLMSSSEPPIMYSTSLWSLPYEIGAPTRLLQAQERAFLRDLREAIEKRVDNKIASARRFAVRVRNHAKMVDCYLTTYYNHKTIFGNRKKISDDIIEYPQKYHIYEGLSTLTNISRYDLPDPDAYRDFFKINPLYEFKKLSETCTYFRGCPINKLDVAIAYDLPELVGKYKKAVETAKEQLPKENKENS